MKKFSNQDNKEQMVVGLIALASIPVLVVIISVLWFSAQNALALSSTIHDQISCEAPSVGGVWNSITSTCTVTTLVIGPDDELVVASNIVFNIGTMTSSYSIVNWGTINIASGGVITTSGAVSNHGKRF